MEVGLLESLCSQKCLSWFQLPQYTLAQDQLVETERATKNETGWWKLLAGRLLVPEALALSLVSQVHQTIHLGREKMEKLIQNIS